MPELAEFGSDSRCIMSEAAEQIQQRMEAARCDLAEEADDIVRSAKQLVDWREYVARYPLASLATAAAIGYLVVPSRSEIVSPDADALLALANRKKLVVQVNGTPKGHGGVLGTLLTLAARAAIRGAVSYLVQRGDGARQAAADSPPDSDEGQGPALP